MATNTTDTKKMTKEERGIAVVAEVLKECGFKDAPTPNKYNIREIYDYLTGGKD